MALKIHKLKGLNDNHELILSNKKEVSFFQYQTYNELSWLAHGFSTRAGGVSEGCFSSMNLGFGRGDLVEHVVENYKRFGEAVGFDWQKAVLSKQTHTTNIRIVTGEDEGKGIVKERDYEDIDGLITNIPGIALVTFYADCVPLYFVDKKKRVIALSHSGWRGTVGKIGKQTIQKMEETFLCRKEDIIAAIGPSICGDCFEVGPEVVAEFKKAFSKEQMQIIEKSGKADRSYLDLWRANYYVLKEAGLKEKQILMTDVCTRCNPEMFYSHRIMGMKRGNQAAVLMIKEPLSYVAE